MDARALETLLAKICQIQSIMFSVSTGEMPIQEMEDEYIHLYLDRESEIEALAKDEVFLSHNNPFRSLWDWYGYWPPRLPTHTSRKQYVRKLYAPLVNPIENVLHNYPSDRGQLEDELRGLAKLARDQHECFTQGFHMALEGLHPKIVERCRVPFKTGQYDDAIFKAMTVVEEMRARISGNSTDIGAPLISQAMDPPSPLLSLSNVKAEQEAAHSLYRGAIGWFKSAVNLRFLNGSGPSKAFECLALGSLLMRMLDEAMEMETNMR